MFGPTGVSVKTAASILVLLLHCNVEGLKLHREVIDVVSILKVLVGDALMWLVDVRDVLSAFPPFVFCAAGMSFPRWAPCLGEIALLPWISSGSGKESRT